ncbi:uncharacterized protein LOC126284769 [Schistocerca gregaria]|uniref:uncharacterized protein LOC126284769 n=1 Tax=Schistocerca gregaria TaxID=7010 RepID=UPI00211F121D|nr:uncharacterized protein LOC126284769 [Schistocerca gregaria]
MGSLLWLLVALLLVSPSTCVRTNQRFTVLTKAGVIHGGPDGVRFFNSSGKGYGRLDERTDHLRDHCYVPSTRCTPNFTYKTRCNECRCNALGTSVDCMRKNCED